MPFPFFPGRVSPKNRILPAERWGIRIPIPLSMIYAAAPEVAPPGGSMTGSSHIVRKALPGEALMRGTLTI